MLIFGKKREDLVDLRTRPPFFVLPDLTDQVLA